MHPREHVSAVVLAAGRGTRMGGPKALLLAAGEPLVLVHARRLAEIAGPVVVVLPPGLDLAHLAWPPRVTTVTSHAPDPAGSLARGVAQLSAATELVIVALVDALPVAARTLQALVEAMSPDTLAATPTYRGRGGHPVVVRRHVLSDGQPRPLRERLRELGERRVRLACDDDPEILSSLNTPRDLQALQARGAAVTIASLDPTRCFDAVAAPQD